MARVKLPNGRTMNLIWYRPTKYSSASDHYWQTKFKDLQSKLAEDCPHLAEQSHCGFCTDGSDRPKKKVKLPNGMILYSSWYKVPTTEADHRKADKESLWLQNDYPRLMHKREEFERNQALADSLRRVFQQAA